MPGYWYDLEDEFHEVQLQVYKLRASWVIDGLVERAVNGVVLLSTTRLVSPDWNVGPNPDLGLRQSVVDYGDDGPSTGGAGHKSLICQS